MPLTWLRRSGNGRSALVVIGAVLLSAPVVHAQQRGTVSGRVTALGTNEPLGDSRLLVVNSSITAISAADGRYTLRGVPSGDVEIRVLRVGYKEQKKAVNVPSGGAATLDFEMSQAVIQLPDVVTTATGEQRRVELGNAVSTLGNVNQKVETTPVNTLTDLLTAKAPSVVVLPNAMTGAAPTIRLRGLASLATNGSGITNDPIYVIDGVRMATDRLNLSTGGTQGSLANDLDPNEIEDIEIVKGPSAATLYGTDAANGVIVITTKRGRAGNTRWTWFGEGGTVKDQNDYPGNYALWGHDAAGKITRCTLITVSQQKCTVDSTTSFNVLKDPSSTPLHTGHRDQYGANVSGGTDQLRYFVSGTLQNELGPIHMPAFAQANLSDSLGTALRDEWLNPEQFQNQSFRLNLSGAMSPKFDLTATAGFNKTNQRLPQVDNNTFSVLYSAWNNPGFNHNGAGTGLNFSESNTIKNPDGTTAGIEFKNGYGGFNPAQIFQRYDQNTTQRFIGSSEATWRPLSWLTNQGTAGIDLADNDFTIICRLNECPPSGTTRQGRLTDNHTNFRNFSAKLVSTATWQARSYLNVKTTIGADYNNLEQDEVDASGQNLPPGAQTIGQAATVSAGNRLQEVDKTLGLYAQEEFGFRDRLWLTVAARTDQNSSFGTKFQRVVYPKAQASWIISDEPFFPRLSWLNQLRLRTAYGASGVQPGGTAALQTLRALTATISAVPGTLNAQDFPGLVEDLIGNANLKPERATEWESGFETDVLGNRAHFDFTYYNSTSHDGIINEPIAASSGASALNVLKNLASVRNTGIEVTLNGTIVDRRSLGWDVTIGASHNSNKILSLGTDAASGKARGQIGFPSTVADSLGLPVNAEFNRPMHFKDANGDGIITPDEVTVDTGYVYIGYSNPRDIFSITNGIDLLNRKLRLTALMDYKGGYILNNSSASFYETNFATFAATNLKSTPLFQQARAVAASSAKNPTTTDIGYRENGQFWRLREVSAAWTLPDVVNHRLRAHDAQIVLSARNLHVWTAYTGVDPEANYTQGNADVQTTFSTTAPRTYYIIRANLHY